MSGYKWLFTKGKDPTDAFNLILRNLSRTSNFTESKVLEYFWPQISEHEMY